MDSLIEIIKILTANIAESPLELKESFLKELKKYKNILSVREALNFVHLKSHSNNYIQFKDCQAMHCIQCLDDAQGVCIHGVRLSPYEVQQIPLLVNRIAFMNDTRKYFKCTQCLRKTKIDSIENKNCECYECSNCVLKRYKNLEIRCKVCNLACQKDEIIRIAKKLNIKKIKIYQECKICKLLIDEKGFVNGVCFICSI